METVPCPASAFTPPPATLPREPHPLGSPRTRTNPVPQQAPEIKGSTSNPLGSVLAASVSLRAHTHTRAHSPQEVSNAHQLCAAAAAAKSLQSCPTLSDPMDCSPPGSSVHGIFQARVLEWGAIAFSTSVL